MAFIGNVLSLGIIAWFFFLAFNHSKGKKSGLKWLENFYDDGKMSPAGYYHIQKQLKKTI